MSEVAAEENQPGRDGTGAFAVLRGHVTNWIARLLGWADENWRFLTFTVWIGIAVYYVVLRWGSIHWMGLGDTDDNIRYVQVKDWLAGQGWYDLRQHRLDPAMGGANIHWSRLVDLPIAALMLFFRLFTSVAQADRLAVGIAPLIPLLPLLLALAFISRRLSPGIAWIAAILAPLSAAMALGMFMPLRIDHHGWQLAFLVTMLAGLVDRNWLRGGVVAGISSALSLAIGMEMIVYLAAAGALIALRWVFKPGAARRMRPYAASLGAGVTLCFLLFASNDNWQPVCDALSPVWLAVMLLASAGMLLLAALPLPHWWQRLLAGAVVGGAVGLFFWLNWPQCLSGAYGSISPELQKSWLANIREAKPIYVQSRSFWVPLAILPVVGVLGAAVACWRFRRDQDLIWAWATVGLMTAFASALLFWQIRTGPAAQLLAIPSAAWLVGEVARALFVSKGRWPRIAGVVGLVALVGMFSAYQWSGEVFRSKPGKYSKVINRANARCRTGPALAVLDQLPPSVIFTMVDLGPRILATTHQQAVAGPYHRNGAAILDIHHAFDGPPEGFRAIAARHRAAYLLICPSFPEGTVYTSRSRNGFYAQMLRGEVPAWLHEVKLKSGAELPYSLWRIDYAARAVGSASAAPVGKKTL